MSARTALATAVVAVAVAGSVLAGAALDPSATPLPPVASFIDVSDAWNAATKNGVPLDPAVLDCALKAFGGQPCAPGGGALIGVPVDSGAPTRTTLPVAGIDPTWSAEVRRRAFAHQVLLTAISAAPPSMSADGGSGSVQSVPSWSAAAHLELFVAESLFFLEADVLGDKCTHYGRAVQNARLLGWTADSAGAPGAAPAAWGALSDRARGLYGQVFDPKSPTAVVPASVCDLVRPRTKSDEEALVKAGIDTALLARFQAEATAAAGLAQGLATDYGSALANASLAVPTDKTMALQRAVETATTDYGYVSRDRLSLHTCASGGVPGCTPLDQQIVDAGAQALAVFTDASPAQGILDSADAASAASVAALHTLVAHLKGFAAKEAGALSTAAQAGLASCALLDETQVPDPNEDPSNPTSFKGRVSTCLGGIALAYGEARSVDASPAELTFAQSLSDLSNQYIHFVTAPP